MVELTDADVTSRDLMPSQDVAATVFRDQADRMWRSVAASFGSPDIADEAVSEAFAQLIRRGAAVRDPERWVWRSAFKIAAGIASSRSRESVREAWDRPVTDVEPPWDLLAALGELSPMQRSSLVLHHYAGYPTVEVARRLGSTPTAVRVHLMRGRRRLRAILSEEEP